ncbi:hypothetical protein F0262_10480 [Vibrio rotiferianus]|uniref:Uncharacterized protein n=1 Tax=Vibrio rotiferianus TaxID=190895 RepID=A0A7Y3Z8I2_9VIBR|nr:hypothetical protein [Vibrio rotiferianus]NOH48482.1 hypothetical protein [Vibrio rotiferianus]
MKMLTMALSAAVLVFSSGTLANSNHQKITAMQQACGLKQVPRLCAVNLPDKSYIGRCVDAKAYGLICVHFKQR